MRTRKKLALVFAAPLAGLLLAEVVVRAFGIRPIPAPGGEGDIAQRSNEPGLRVENIPGGWMRTIYFDRARNVVKVVEAHVNGQGFRGPEVPLEKEPGSVRIACLGDSQTFGHGVADDESWPANLAAGLRERLPGRTVEVLNCGVGGFETEEELALFERRVQPYLPDLLLLGFFLNDTALPGVRIEPPESSRAQWVARLAPGRRAGFLGWLRGTSRVVNLACEWQFRRLSLARWVEQRGPLFAPDFEGWIRVQAALRKLRDLQAARGARFAVVLVPLLMREGDELLSSEPYRIVARFLASEGIPCFDPEPEFAGVADVDSLRVHDRDLHSNPEAQRRIGQGVARWLVEQHLVP
jgi:lysophospholipase L1-like esterase